MRAAVYREFAKPLVIENVPDPTSSDDGVVIGVKATGLCRSDWHGWMGHDPDISLPHVPGHELAGVVEATGKDVVQWNVGDRVTLPFVCGCGKCPQCAQAHKYPALLTLIRAGKLFPEKLVEKTISLEEGLDELANMDSFKGTGITIIDRF